MRPVVFVDLGTMRGQLTQVVVNIPHKSVILAMRDPVPAGCDVNKPSDETRLGVCDMDRRVCTHEDHAVELHLIRRLELLVHRHLLVSDKTIEHSVIGNAR